MADDQDGQCERVVLQGSLRVRRPRSKGDSMREEGEGDSQEAQSLSFSQRLRANLNLSILKHSFSGARVQNLAINLANDVSL